MRKIIVFLAVCALSLFAKPVVTTSILPTKFFVEQIAGDTLDVNAMVGKGADPHTYEPKPKQMKELEKSELYFAIGIEFEDAWLDRFSKTFKNLRIVKTQEGIEKIAMSDEHEHEEHHHEHHHDDEECCCHHHHEEEEHDEEECCCCGHDHHDHEHHHHHHHHGHDADEVFTSIGIETVNKYSVEDIALALSELDEHIIRAKGIVPSHDGSWLFFDYVPGDADIRIGSPAYTGLITVIGDKVDVARIKEIFAVK